MPRESKILPFFIRLQNKYLLDLFFKKRSSSKTRFSEDLVMLNSVSHQDIPIWKTKLIKF